MATQFNVVFVLGGPGAGKGTQCQNIVDAYKYKHLSAGDLLREERADPHSSDGQLIEHHIKEGSIVPVAITCRLLEKAMGKAHDTEQKNDFLIDGFPRNKDNLDGWNTAMSDKVNLKCILWFDCSEQVCIDRCLSRGAAGSGRTDDNIESLRKRIVTYETGTKPIINHYAEMNLVKKIDAARSPDEVFADVKQVFDGL